MATIIRIKRSGTSGDPSTLAAGELAYSYLAGGVNNGGGRLYVGTGTETAGDAASHDVIGGKYFMDMLDHARGTVQPLSALITDSDGKIDGVQFGTVTIDSSTISTLDSGAVTFKQELDMNGHAITSLATPTNSTDAATKGYVDAVIGGDAIQLSLAGDTGTGDVTLSDSSLSFTGGTGLTSTVSGASVQFDLDDTTVSAGSYGSATAIPTFTVDAQGRLTAASSVNISTDLSISGDNGSDTVSLLDSSLTFAGDAGAISTTVTDNQVQIAARLASTSQTGVASFSNTDFQVNGSGQVTLTGDIGGASIPLQFLLDGSDSATASGGAITINGGEGIDVTAPTANSIRIAGENASTTNKGIASFANANFTVTAGDVAAKAITLGSTSLELGGSTTTLAGLTQLDVDNIRILDNTIGSTSGQLFIDPAPIDSEGGTVIIRGDLTVRGVTTTIQSQNVSVGDLTLNLGDSADNNVQADGAGITIGSSSYSGTKPAFTYDGATDRWDANKPLDISFASLDSAIFLNGTSIGEVLEDRMANDFLKAGEGIDLTYNDPNGTLTISGELATITNAGIASFDSANFEVITGQVSLVEIDGGEF